jgi:hypothetical protein
MWFWNWSASKRLQRVEPISVSSPAHSTEAKQELEMVVGTDNKIRELQRDLAISQTARKATKALEVLLPQ